MDLALSDGRQAESLAVRAAAEIRPEGEDQGRMEGSEGKMNDPETFKNPCAICHKRPATRYCDYIIGYSNPQMFMRDFQQLCAHNGPDYETCDVPMCEDCAENISREIDFCPYHFELYQKAKEIPADLRKSQARVKKQINYEILHGSD